MKWKAFQQVCREKSGNKIMVLNLYDKNEGLLVIQTYYICYGFKDVSSFETFPQTVIPICMVTVI